MSKHLQKNILKENDRVIASGRDPIREQLKELNKVSRENDVSYV